MDFVNIFKDSWLGKASSYIGDNEKIQELLKETVLQKKDSVMKRLFVAISCVMMTCAAFGQGMVGAKGVECTKSDSTLVVRLLKEAKEQRGEEHRMLWFGKKFIGVPYVAHTLEKGNEEHLIVNLHELDCTTFVETVVALSLCDQQNKRSFEDYCRNLTRIRYREGKMKDYTSRLHYFTWWGEDNERKGIVREIVPSKEEVASEGWGAFTGVQTLNINYMSTHPTLYKQLKANPKFVSVIKRYEEESKGKKYRFIPKRNVGWAQSSALGIVHDGDIIAMLTSKAGLDTSHIGIAVWQNGKLHLLNASYVYKKVVLDTKTFYDYQQVQTSQTGIRVFRGVEN